MQSIRRATIQHPAMRMLTRLVTPALGAALFLATPAAALQQAPAAAASETTEAAPAGAKGGAGLAIKAAKILTAKLDSPGFVNNGVILIKDGVIEAVGPARSTSIPEGYEVRDVGDRWLTPGMIDLHCHVAGTFDINDMVYLTNPGVRAWTSVRPGNSSLLTGLASGVTTVLFIPGSGTNIGGQGVLVKTHAGEFPEVLVRNPGSMKLAQAGNPERYLRGVSRTFMNWNTRDTLERGIEYAKKWEAFEKDGGDKPLKDPQWEIFRNLRNGSAQISAHTQIYQVVLASLSTVVRDLKLPFYIDHGTFDSHRIAPLAEELGVYAILGPRNLDVPSAGFIRWSGSNPERMQGVAAGYQANGHTRVGFNTDSPVIPQHELFMQAGIGCRLGFDNSKMDAVRGLTIIPAMAAGIDVKAGEGPGVGSLEVGKSADILCVTGDLADPRTAVDQIWVNGKSVYDTETQRRRF